MALLKSLNINVGICYAIFFLKKEKKKKHYVYVYINTHHGQEKLAKIQKIIKYSDFLINELNKPHFAHTSYFHN